MWSSRVLNSCESSASRPGHFTPSETFPDIYWMGYVGGQGHIQFWRCTRELAVPEVESPVSQLSNRCLITVQAETPRLPVGVVVVVVSNKYLKFHTVGAS